jgi:Cysteine-rich secretory protein family
MVRSQSFHAAERPNDGRRRRPRRWAGALAVVVATVLLPLSAAHASSGSGQFVSDTNSARSSHGVESLATNADLTSVAQQWAQHMADSGNLSHNPALANIKNWDKLGENVGYGPDVASIQDAFMHSSGHRANILDNDFTEIGVGVVVKNGVVWVSEVFRQPEYSTATPTHHKAAPKKHVKPQPAKAVVEVNRTTAEKSSATKTATPKPAAKASAAKTHTALAAPRASTVPSGAWEPATAQPSTSTTAPATVIAQGPGGPTAATKDAGSDGGGSSLPAAGALGLLAVLGLAISLRARSTS